ncbi:TIGR04376 family protein [Spirulina major CS-329]|jgi:uncharacterized protein (TIGR04376 family)|uniref:TIGR04376 family protein n=1 Tax=Spirulina TaxID=1154 RepID=UPI00232AFFB7|nr:MULTISPECIES: TIGR04376 family protein [Spirulina]MDB9494628.1 TIGR04376 family protein [Spirulina subsalsa CS-330]MDB9502728.1 TIGR04376 family protein [Spirulina major CS-329]
MSVFDDVSQFLEERLDEFLQNNPQLQLQVLEEQLREQEAETQRLIQRLNQQVQQLEQEILAIAADIKLWHQRIAKAEAAGRYDLANPAREREAALLRQGNQRWGQLESTKQNRSQAEHLLAQTVAKQKELAAKVAAEAAAQPKPPQASPPGWQNASRYRAGVDAFDAVDAQFREWEIEADLQTMKKDLGL